MKEKVKSTSGANNAPSELTVPAPLVMVTCWITHSLPQPELISSAAPGYVLLIAWLELLAAEANICIVLFRQLEQDGFCPVDMGIPMGRKYG